MLSWTVGQAFAATSTGGADSITGGSLIRTSSLRDLDGGPVLRSVHPTSPDAAGVYRAAADFVTLDRRPDRPIRPKRIT